MALLSIAGFGLVHGCSAPDAGSDASEGSPDAGVPSDDLDGDWVPSGFDCNDADPLVRPGAPERCNRSDDDCDGAVDEGAWTNDGTVTYDLAVEGARPVAVFRLGGDVAFVYAGPSLAQIVRAEDGFPLSETWDVDGTCEEAHAAETPDGAIVCMSMRRASLSAQTDCWRFRGVLPATLTLVSRTETGILGRSDLVVQEGHVVAVGIEGLLDLDSGASLAWPRASFVEAVRGRAGTFFVGHGSVHVTEYDLDSFAVVGTARLPAMMRSLGPGPVVYIRDPVPYLLAVRTMARVSMPFDVYQSDIDSGGEDVFVLGHDRFWPGPYVYLARVGMAEGTPRLLQSWRLWSNVGGDYLSISAGPDLVVAIARDEVRAEVVWLSCRAEE